MTQEEKQLLLKDLCARLPYEPAYDCMYGSTSIGTPRYLTPLDLHDILECDWLDGVRLYLRPMSSMTEEEKKEFHKECEKDYKIVVNETNNFYKSKFDEYAPLLSSYHKNDWLNTHHFDYRGLIEKGLALEAPEGMYDIKNN